MLLIISLFVSFSFTYSIENDFENQHNILVKIKDRIITKNDFIKRAEYTIRPAYCKLDNNISKKIILNSLIAEKLMAIDIEKNLLSDNYSNEFIDGFKEQKMRELLLKEKVYDLIKIDSLLVQSHYYNSTKKYNIQFLSFNSDILAKQVDSLLKNDINFLDICYNYLNLKSIPNRIISYFDEHDPAIHNAIFSKIMEKNEIVGPILSKDKKVLFLKILGWENTPIITKQNKIEQLESIQQKIYENEYIKGYDLYVSNIMEGMNLLLFEEPFLKLAHKTFEESPSQQKNKTPYWDTNNLNLSNDKYDINPNEDILSFNNSVYTIASIESLITKHPLVFRKENISKSEYPLQLKYAIVDLLRDEQLNIIAYNNYYDNHPEVLKEVQIFRDAILSNFHFRTYLEGKNISLDEFNNNHLNIIENHLNDYVELLISKYSSEISINFNIFDKIKLTHIDLYTYRKGVPYPFIVPTFPILTSKHRINPEIEINLPQ